MAQFMALLAAGCWLSVLRALGQFDGGGGGSSDKEARWRLAFSGRPRDAIDLLSWRH